MGSHPHGAQGDAITQFLLLHDEGGSPETWAELIDVLEGRGHTALALRLPGGRWDDEVAFVHRHVVAPGETAVVGYGAGGLLARGYATVHPGTLKGVATVAAPAAPDDEPQSVGFDVPGREPRIAVICEGDDVVDYDEQKRAAYEWRAQPGSVPGGHEAHRRHPALVATLLINWLAPETT